MHSSPPPREAPNNAAACGLAAIEQTPTPRLRYFRITFSVACGLLCILLIVLWVRSYWWGFSVRYNYLDNDVVGLASESGLMSLHATDFRYFDPAGQDCFNDLGFWVDGGVAHASSREYSPWDMGVATNNSYPFRFIILPAWAPALLFTVFAVIPWLHFKRFSLRTLLIALTLVSVICGLVVWSMRQS